MITPDDALVEYLEDHGLRRVAKRLVSTGVLEVVATAIPGIRKSSCSARSSNSSAPGHRT